jgi:hypothetical protein
MRRKSKNSVLVDSLPVLPIPGFKHREAPHRHAQRCIIASIKIVDYRVPSLPITVFEVAAGWSGDAPIPPSNTFLFIFPICEKSCLLSLPATN